MCDFAEQLLGLVVERALRERRPCRVRQDLQSCLHLGLRKCENVGRRPYGIVARASFAPHRVHERLFFAARLEGVKCADHRIVLPMPEVISRLARIPRRAEGAKEIVAKLRGSADEKPEAESEKAEEAAAEPATTS